MSKNFDNLNPTFIKIAPEHIVYLKSLIETYEGLGVVRTLNRLNGELVILSLDETKQDLENLLHSLKSEIEFHIISKPASLCEDWLLSDNIEE
ncbi:MAG: DUF4911 domain-containing protein [Proteobacteria bacterium]|nr:DUF4911 domain-containing protein [Pseudomonadota bacterium]